MGEAAAQRRYQVRLEAVRDRLAPQKIANAYRVLAPSARRFSADLVPHQSIQPPFHTPRLDLLKTLSIDASGSAVRTAASPGVPEHVPAPDLVIKRVEAIGRICIRFGIQRPLELPNALGSC